MAPGPAGEEMGCPVTLYLDWPLALALLDPPWGKISKSRDGHCQMDMVHLKGRWMQHAVCTSDSSPCGLCHMAPTIHTPLLVPGFTSWPPRGSYNQLVWFRCISSVWHKLTEVSGVTGVGKGNF
jgi:hypothetical protein